MNCKFTNLVLNIGEEADAGWAEVSEDSRGSGSGLPRLIRWGLEAPPLLICHGAGGGGLSDLTVGCIGAWLLCKLLLMTDMRGLFLS